MESVLFGSSSWRLESVSRLPCSSPCPVSEVRVKSLSVVKLSSSMAPPMYFSAKRSRLIRVESLLMTSLSSPASLRERRISRMMMLLMSTGRDLPCFLGLERWSMVCWIFSRPVRGSRMRCRSASKRRAEVMRTSCCVMRSLREIPPTKRLADSIRRPIVSRTITRCTSILVQESSSTRSSCTGLSKTSVSKSATRLAASRWIAGMRKRPKGRR